MVADNVDSYFTKDFMWFLMCTDNIYFIGSRQEVITKEEEEVSFPYTIIP